MLDGMPFPDLEAKRFDPPQEKAEWTWTVKLPPGRHTLQAFVKSEYSSSRSEPVGVAWTEEAKRPVLHVLPIGINDYQNGLRRLTCAARDAQDLAAAFALEQKGLLFRDVRIEPPLVNKNATAAAIRKKLQALALPGQVNQEDVVVVFFSGHGTVASGDFYLLTADSDPQTLGKHNAISGGELGELLGGLRCRVLLLLDACHSGAADLRPAGDNAARALSDDEVGVTVLSACMGKQTAKEQDGNGLFTLAIREALQGHPKVHPSDDGRLFVHHLNTYVVDRVGELSGYEQTPFLRPPYVVQTFVII
jgi:uncharacterized caspase-like protein